MKHVLAILGHKGGGGKSTSTHLAAFGMTMLGYPVVHVSTDTDDDLQDDTNRPYRTYSGRSESELKAILGKFQSMPDPDGNAFLIIDGGASKQAFDLTIAEWSRQFSHLILLPFRDNQKDYKATLKALERLPDALALRCQWPSYPRRPVAEAEVKEFFAGREERFFDHEIPYNENLRLITNDGRLDSLKKAKTEAKQFAISIRHHLGIKV